MTLFTVTQQLKKGIEIKNEHWSAACLLKMVTFIVHKLILLHPTRAGRGKRPTTLPVRKCQVSTVNAWINK